jgi:23S rRNA pseudouridine2457 synthase
MLLSLNKPFNVLCQFTDRSTPPRRTLAEFSLPKNVYAAGRLDFDSEGLMLLTDNGTLSAQISSPKFKWPKTYLVQVEGDVSEQPLEQLRRGVKLDDGLTLPAQARLLEQAPEWLWPRDPPVRFRKSISDHFIELTISEGRNRQVRRMTAAVGLPTLRLVRIAIGPYQLNDLSPGQWREESPPTTQTHAGASSFADGDSNRDKNASNKPLLINRWRRDGR